MNIIGIIVLLILILLISYIIIRHFLINKINVSKTITKYSLGKIDKLFLKERSTECDIGILANYQRVLFYTETEWSTSENHNYILNIPENKYYIIDKGYYYYLENSTTKLFLNSVNVKIFLFDFDKYYKKINLI
jgi:di/tricarboxylate transporter